MEEKTVPISKVPLITTIILLILLVAGTAYDIRIQKAQQAALTKTNPDAKAKTISPISSNTLIRSHGYRVIVPNSYQVKEDRQESTVSSLRIIKQGTSDQTQLLISRSKATEKDPCLKKTTEFPQAKCKDISEYRMLDWGTEFTTTNEAAVEFRYTVIEGGFEYQLQFLGMDMEEKNQILSTFKLNP